MFYIKHKGECLTISENNLYGRCRQCGTEYAIDPDEILHDGPLYFYGNSAYCDKCARGRKSIWKRMRPHIPAAKQEDMKP